MNETNQQKLEESVLLYVTNWLAHGAPPQRYEVFSKLTWPIPTACIELWCLINISKEWHLWCTQRSEYDPIYPDMWHNMGSAAMLTDFIGPESEHLIKEVPFLETVFNKAKDDPSRYNLKNPRSRIIQRILRKDSGIKDEKHIMSLINNTVSVGIHYDLTPRGAETVELVILEATEIKDSFRNGRWIKITEIPELIKNKQFVAHQWPRLQRALENWMKIK